VPPYPPDGFYLLYTPGWNLYIPQEWTTTLTAQLLGALAVEPSSCTLWGEDADGVMWGPGIILFNPAVPPLFDCDCRLYAIIGVDQGIPNAFECGARGAFLEAQPPPEQPPMPPGTGPVPPRPTGAVGKRTAADFYKPLHGAVWMYLKYGLEPTWPAGTASGRRKSWRTNARTRFKLTLDGTHLQYNAAKRKRKDEIRQANLTLHPFRIVAFSDEYNEVH
jgi:hypothetical protein